MSPTRELAIQIKDHLSAVVPVKYQDKIKVCAIVGGMSIQKQLRLLKYKPQIIIATPGRLWELMTEHSNRYLLESMPMTDVIVLDEADRMIADGHFKELRDILAHVYTQRLKIKTKKPLDNIEEILPKQEDTGFKVAKGLEGKDEMIDWSKVKDLYDEDEIMEDIQK